jgi:class 3 adenylate cyclase
MTLRNDLESQVNKIFSEQWSERKGQRVPLAEDMRLSNDAVKLNAVVLYADLSESTKLVDSKNDFFAAEVYKTYLHCAAKIIRSQSGEITSYDGDRIMAVYIGDRMNSRATKAAFQINDARLNIINPIMKKNYQDSNYEVKHTVGIDSSDLFVARTGIRGSNDLVWVGRAANHAAKLGSLPNDFPTRITEEVHQKLSEDLKVNNGKAMWEKVTWNPMNRTVYRSTWSWPVS